MRASKHGRVSVEAVGREEDRAIRIIALGRICSRRRRAVGTVVIVRVARHGAGRKEGSAAFFFFVPAIVG